MIKILVVADIHGDFESLSKFVNNLEIDDFDLVVCPGDFTDMYNIPESYSQLEIAEIIIQKLISLKKPLFCVPGNHDPYEILELFDEYCINLHEKKCKFKNVFFIGFGGAETPFNTKFEPTEAEIEKALERIVKKGEGTYVLITHNPPFRTKLDRIDTGQNVGSKSVRKFIEKEEPILAISAHIHEAGGIDKLGKTHLFYPGALYEGFYGIVTIDEEKNEVKCEIRKAKLQKKF
ncbi:MAG: metallophosphoesterase [Candidatus Aenigmatarchaeota archaeon]